MCHSASQRLLPMRQEHLLLLLSLLLLLLLHDIDSDVHRAELDTS